MGRKGLRTWGPWKKSRQSKEREEIKKKNEKKPNDPVSYRAAKEVGEANGRGEKRDLWKDYGETVCERN